MKQWIQRYIEQQQFALTAIPINHVETIIRTLKTAMDNDKQIFVFGNGGSAANAMHFATDLGKGAADKLGKRFKVICLNDNQSWMTALANDYSYDDVFWRQLQRRANPGDVIIPLSVSGKSPNIVKATNWAQNYGCHVLKFPSYNIKHYGRVEDIHMTMLHMAAYAFIEGIVQ